MTKTAKKKIYCGALSVAVSLLAVLLVFLLQIPSPMVVLLIPVVFFTYKEGYYAGALSGLVAFGYALFFFSQQSRLFTYSPADLAILLTSAAVIMVIIGLVGKLKAHDDKSAKEVARLSDNLHNTLRGMDVQILVTELHTDYILFTNEKMNRIYEIDYDPLGLPCWQVYHGFSQRCDFCPLQQLYDNPLQSIEWEYQNRRTGRWFHNYESFIPWTDGRIVHLQQGIDITERKEMEMDLQAAKRQAEKSNRAKSDFLSRMSHELRTPMNAIVGMTKMAAKTENIERIREYLAQVDDASLHLLGLINDILDMSKIEAGKFALSNSDFVLEKMLKRVINVNNYRFEEKNQCFTIYVEADVPTAIVADQQRLVQVITNLLSNAAKFTPQEGHIGLSVSLVQESEESIFLQFDVTDEGIGMTQEQLSRLFRPFEQADGSITRRFGGTGLGLAISKTIVEMMGGTIAAESKVNEGSRFSFTIRAKKGTAAGASRLHTRPDDDFRLLTVDDSQAALRCAVAFSQRLGLSLDTAATAEEALQRLHANPYRMAFVNWKIPGMDGIALASKIRAEFAGVQPVIMISASDWSEIEKGARAAGIEHFVGKPLLPSTMADCINLCFEKNAEVERKSEEGQEAERRDLFQGRRLLLVEDIALNREIVKMLLEETGIEVQEAESGEAACEMFRGNPDGYDMLFMDIHMPGMDGFEATRQIRESALPGADIVPIIAMTASNFKEDIDHCFAVGMNDHITKPVDANEMIEKMRRYMPVAVENRKA